jgi:hypothetical protein
MLELRARMPKPPSQRKDAPSPAKAGGSFWIDGFYVEQRFDHLKVTMTRRLPASWWPRVIEAKKRSDGEKA